MSRLAPFSSDSDTFPEKVPTKPPNSSLLSPPSSRRKIRRSAPFFRTPRYRRPMRVGRGCKLNSDTELSPKKAGSEEPSPSRLPTPTRSAPKGGQPPDMRGYAPPQSPPAPSNPGGRKLPKSFIRSRTLPAYFYMKDTHAAGVAARAASEEARCRRLLLGAEEQHLKEEWIEDGEEEEAWIEEDVPWCR